MLLAEARRVVLEAETLGEYLKRARERAGLTNPLQAQRAANNAIHANTIRQIEKNRVDRPAAETLKVLAELYHLDYQDLLRRSGYLEDEDTPSAAANEDAEFLRLYRAATPRMRELVVSLLQETAHRP